ncbi:MAG: hypothetical protein Q4D23_00985 [Bacteroidales bacterium]|nr:hypothetical protein [Bacteroidales bacterium]
MKRLIYIIIVALAALLLLRFIGEFPVLETSQPKNFNINGVWINTQTAYLDSTGAIDKIQACKDTIYKVYADSKVHKYVKRNYYGKPRLVPYTSEPYLFMPDIDSLYAEGDVVIPIVEMHDSVLNILWHGTIQHWRRFDGISQKEQKDLIAFSDMVMEREYMFWGQENLYEWYITAHNEVRTRTYIIMACLLLLFIGGCWMMWFYRRNRRLTAALADLQEEIKERPEAIRETTRQLSDELYASDWYLDLKRRAGDAAPSLTGRAGGGAHFSPDDWAEIERQVRRLHPTFRGRLYSLYAFSETEYRVCLLLKLHFTPTEIATAICKDKSTVSTIRGRLYTKVFDKKGSSKAWDEFIEQI